MLGTCCNLHSIYPFFPESKSLSVSFIACVTLDPMNYPRQFCSVVDVCINNSVGIDWLCFCPFFSGASLAASTLHTSCFEKDCLESKQNSIPIQMLTPTFLWPLVGLAVAPFPPEHQYNFLNPVIDPWWGYINSEYKFLWNETLKIGCLGNMTNKVMFSTCF